MKRRLTWIALGVALVPLLSTCYSAVTPHENFKGFHERDVGKSADDPSTSVSRYPQKLIGTRKLQNGNIENEYFLRGTCRYFYEIDPKTRLIVRFRFEGNVKDCGIVPV